MNRRFLAGALALLLTVLAPLPAQPFGIGKLGANFGRLGSPGGKVSSFDIFIDSSRPDDTGNGLSPATAKKTIAAGQALVSAPKKRIGLAGGSSWREELRIVADNITVGCYKSCATRPILDASDQILNANFTKTAGLTNVYQTTTITFAAGGTAAWINVFETGGPGDNPTGTFLNFVSSNALVDSTPCSYTIAGMVPDTTLAASGQIFIHTCDGTSPIVNGYLYEFSNRPTGIFLNGLNNRVVGIETRKNADELGSLQCQTDGAACTFTNVLARLGNKHNAFAACGSTVANSQFINGYYSTTVSTPLVFFDNVGSGKPITISNTIIQQDQNLSGASTSALFGHTANGSCGNVSIGGNTWLIAKNGANMSGVSWANIGTLSIDSTFGSQLTNFVAFAQNGTLTNSQAVSDFANNTQIRIDATSTITMSSSKICASKNQNGLFDVPPGGAGSAITITNNQFYANAPITNFSLIFQVFTSYLLTANGNDFGTGQSPGGGFLVYNDFGTSGSTFTGDNNIYETTGGNTPTLVLNNNSQTTLSGWQTLTGQDAHSTFGTGTAVNACTLPTIPVVN